MTTNPRLRSAVRLALGATAGSLTAFYSPVSSAQDEAQADLEEILVTGSRIPRADLASASPVSVIDREDIVITGLTDVGNLIQRMPSMSGSPIGTTTNNGGNGSVLIDLRGMGTDRTVTLINGHRTVDGGDYQTIPANMIERVEILKDGASAVYGADAVAGVVNIITRRDFEGIEVSVQNADFFDMDSGAQNTIGVFAGTTFENGGNVVFGAEYVNQEEAYQRDAPWDYFQNAYYIYPEGCENQVAAPYDGTPSGGCYPLGSSRIPQSRLQFFQARDFLVDANGQRILDANGDPIPTANDYPGNGLFFVGDPATAPYQAGLLEAGFPGTYNFSPVNYIQTPYERTNVFGEARFDITETIRFNSSLRGNFRESSQELAPVPYTPGDPFYNGFFTNPVTGERVAYSGISEENYYLRQAIDQYNAANGTALPYEPITDARRRMIESARRFEQRITQYQFLAGLEGEFNELNWDVYYNRGYRSRTDSDLGQFSGPRLSNALGPSADLDGNGQPECYAETLSPGVVDPSTIITGCVPLNLFGGGEVDPITSAPTVTTLTPDMIAYINADLTDTFTTSMEQAGFSIAGEAFDLPGGKMGWAAGYGYWGQTFTYNPDSGKATGTVTGNVGAGTDGSLYNNAVFGEVLLPMFDNGDQSLNLRAGVRRDEYNIFDGETTWQAGIEFQAIESVKLRGTASTVFRAPTITNLFGGQVDSFPTYNDPCIPPAGEPLPANCEQVGVQIDSQVRARIGGNPNLVPETGETFTAGLVWTPEFAGSDSSVTVDYWQIDIEDGISSLGVQFTLDQCYLEGNEAACAQITRNPDYSINQIQDFDLNVADQGARGVDTEIRWSMDSELGQWEAALLWSHLLERTKTAFAGASEQDLSGRFTDPTAEDGGAYATDKFNYSVQWYRNNFSVGYLGEFISELDADTFCNCNSDGDASNNLADGTYIQKVDAMLYHDLVASYTFEQTGTHIAAGVTNLTDEEPPYMDIGFNANTDPSTYRLFGRGYYLRLTQNFE